MKNIIEKLKSKKLYPVIATLFYLGIIVGLLVKVFYFQFTSKINMIPFNEPININMLKASLGCILIVFAIMYLVSFKKTATAFLVTYIIFSILLFADTLYSRYYSNPLTATVVLYQIRFLKDIQSSTSSLIKFKDIILFIDIPLFFLYKRFLLPRKNEFKILWKSIFFIAGMVLGLSLIKYVYSHSDVNQYIWEKKYMARDLGVLYYHYDDLKVTVKRQVIRNTKLTDDEIEKINRETYKQKRNQYTGIAEGKNLIVLQLEAMQGFVINRDINGKEITPNLNKLLKNSIYCKNMFYQASWGNTSDAEFVTNTSMYPAKSGAVYYMYPANKYNSFANILKDQGYYTGAFHGYEPSFWNRTDMYRSLGFDRFYSKNDFDMKEKVGWAVSDSQFVKQSIDYLIEDSGGKNFYGFLVSLSLHHPFDAFISYDFDVGEFEGTMLGNFLKGANYVDKVIGEMIDYLKEKGLYDDTVIVIYGDHAAMFEDQSANLTKFLGIEHNSINWSSLQQVAGMIHVPGLKGIEIDEPTGQIDIMPTVANLMNFKNPYMFGRDILSDSPAYELFGGGAKLATKDYIYIGEKGVYYDFNTKEKFTSDELQEEVAKYLDRYNLSNLMLEKDAIRKLSKSK